MSTLTVIGVGNAQYGDDGVGVAVIEALRDSRSEIDLELIEGGTDALGLLEYLPNRKRVVIIDAARMDEQPGTVRCFDPAEANLVLQWDHLSLHGVGLAETYRLATQLDMLPDQLWVIGIQPAEVMVQNQLSPEVQAAIPKVIDLIYKFAQNLSAQPCPVTIRHTVQHSDIQEEKFHGR